MLLRMAITLSTPGAQSVQLFWRPRPDVWIGVIRDRVTRGGEDYLDQYNRWLVRSPLCQDCVGITRQLS